MRLTFFSLSHLFCAVHIMSIGKYYARNGKGTEERGKFFESEILIRIHKDTEESLFPDFSLCFHSFFYSWFTSCFRTLIGSLSGKRALKHFSCTSLLASCCLPILFVCSECVYWICNDTEMKNCRNHQTLLRPRRKRMMENVSPFWCEASTCCESFRGMNVWNE